MSVQKKLATLSNNDSLISVLPGSLYMSALRKTIYIKNKDTFQVSSDRELTVQNAIFGSQASFRVREQFTRNFVLQITLPIGTYTLVENWAENLIVRVTQRIGGDNEIVKNGWANTLQTIRESETIEKRDKYMIKTGSATSNPTSPVKAYVFLNIQTSSINKEMSQYYPNYQLNQHTEFLIDFNYAENIISAGTAPLSMNARVFYEYAAVLHNKDLRPKFDGPNGKGGEQLNTHEIVSYVYNIKADGSLSKSVDLRSFPTSEIDELVFFVTNTSDIVTTKNRFLTQPVTNIKLTMSDREIIDSKDSFDEIKQLWRQNCPNVFKVGGVEKRFYVLDLSPINYVRSESRDLYVQGVILSEEDILLEFDVPTDVPSVLHIMGIKKTIHHLKNGNLARVY